MGSLPSTSHSAHEGAGLAGRASPSAGQSPGSKKGRSWKQWGKQKLWRSGSSSAVESLANPGALLLSSAWLLRPGVHSGVLQ
jgi:hypothetical protein